MKIKSLIEAYAQACVNMSWKGRLMAGEHAEVERAYHEAKAALYKAIDGETLDNYCQLHERIDILYVVDGWEARYSIADGDVFVISAMGESIMQAMFNLDILLAAKSREDWKKQATRNHHRSIVRDT